MIMVVGSGSYIAVEAFANPDLATVVIMDHNMVVV